MSVEKLKKSVSVYKNFSTNLGEQSIYDLLLKIKNGEFESDINSIRYASAKGDGHTAGKLKAGLLAFTTSGIFTGARSKGNLERYSGLICLDYDNIPPDALSTLKKRVIECSFTFGAFISPSGTGLKIIVPVNWESEKHSEGYKVVSLYYDELTNEKCDEKCKDISRLCFVSFDSDCYINIEAQSFEINSLSKSKNSTNLLEKCLIFTERKMVYQNRNRNNFVYQFVNNANRDGINEQETLEFCVSTFCDLEEKEVVGIVRNVYKNQTAEFAKFADSANFADISFDSEFLEDIKFTPPIPCHIYNVLPNLIKQGCDVLGDERQKDIFLTATLSVLSGCLPNVSGLYFGKNVYPNLFSFVVAPPASNKGVLTFAKDLAKTYHAETIQHSKKLRSDYNVALLEHKKDNNSIPPVEPHSKIVLIPANTSAAAIYQHLEMNGGSGIICETEADTMGQAFKQDWGSYSHILRQAFHHEPISISRKTNREFLEVAEPKLSIALTGTPNQVANIIPSAEDGLFSRFIFYTFEETSMWNDPSPHTHTINLTEHFRKLSEQVYQMVKFYEIHPTLFNLELHQWKILNQEFHNHLLKVNTLIEGNSSSLVKRHGLILYRLCMILSAIRNFESSTPTQTLICSDVDFNTALELVNIYLDHSIFIYETLPKVRTETSSKQGGKKGRFFDTLPIIFSRKEAVAIGQRCGIAERTVDDIIKKSLGKLLTRQDYGEYEKIKTP